LLDETGGGARPEPTRVALCLDTQPSTEPDRRHDGVVQIDGAVDVSGQSSNGLANLGGGAGGPAGWRWRRRRR
jgi:hypothetical protein